MKRHASIIVTLVFLATLSACAGMTKRERSAATGTAIGAGMGAILGQALGRNTPGTLIGAGVGAVLGGLAGDQAGAYMDRQEEELRRAVARSEAAAIRRADEARAAAEVAVVERTHDILTASFKSEVLFDFDSAELRLGARKELARVARVLKRYPDTSILVEGHADTRGPRAYNQELSETRARAVRDALVLEGVDPGRIGVVSYGESEPLSSNHAMNRRVTIVIKPTSEAKG